MCSFNVYDFSFEKSPRHDAYVPKFEAELAQFCEKLVGCTPLFFFLIYIYILMAIMISRFYLYIFDAPIAM